jgi:phosphoglycerol transferase MdoB-like AlkP superfamily enzyme
MYRNLLRSRFGGVFIFLLVFTMVATVTRLALTAHAWKHLDHGPVQLVGVLLSGIVFDVAAALYFAIPVLLVSFLLPQRAFTMRWVRAMVCGFFVVAIGVLLFGAVAEWFFWEEFSSRFNFIAVDYLIYTTEVIGNINESYPMPLILSGLTVVTAAGFFGLWKTRLLQTWFNGAVDAQWSRKGALVWLALLCAGHFGLSNRLVPDFGNSYNQEIARNGVYAFGAAFWENSLDFEKFYSCLPQEEAMDTTRRLIFDHADSSASTHVNDITRDVVSAGPERTFNVIQITVESLSAKFLGVFGGKKQLTPVMDRLFEESLVFTNFYATGTRTVRGMEALTLCVPPTPGQSIVRRPNNGNLFSTGSIFRQRGYDTAFIYSGYGYFDNMNAFFDANGYRVIDRSSVAKEDITYATVWGACDEDLYRWTLREADKAFAEGKPFHHFVMTTSNHRPYGIPEGRIDLPGGTRNAAVKYTDYAIGKLLEEAAAKPWFTNTIFIIVGDHCASAAGKTALPITGYHIPAFVWNPGLIPPRKVSALCSQIDLLPTVFGLMNWSYRSRFFGKDVLRMKPEDERAFIATYQRLGYFRDGKLAVIEPVKHDRMYSYTTLDGPLSLMPNEPVFLNEAIAQYQSASWLFANGVNRQDDTR